MTKHIYYENGSKDAHHSESSSAQGAKPSRLLSGLRVLDLTRLLPGAFCTQFLADFGAEVIKIEQPGLGDYWRWSQPKAVEQSVQFLALNRGKRSITLNLKNPDSREAFLRLCETADVIVEGFRPGVMDRLDLTTETMHARNPRLVICSISGFGQSSPWSKVAAHDLNFLGLSGLMQLAIGREEDLSPTGLPIGDIGGGALMALIGILAALNDTARTLKGHVVDVSVLDGLFSWSGFMAAGWNAPSKKDIDIPFDTPFNKPFYSVFETSDGKHMITGAYEKKFWQKLCEVMQRPDWLDKQWVDGLSEQAIRADMEAVFRTKTQDEWIDIFSENEACVTPVYSLRDALNSEHAQAVGSMIEVDDPIEGKLKHVGNPLRIDGASQNALDPAPVLGADTDDLLATIGFSRDEIAEMRNTGAI